MMRPVAMCSRPAPKTATLKRCCRANRLRMIAGEEDPASDDDVNDDDGDGDGKEDEEEGGNMLPPLAPCSRESSRRFSPMSGEQWRYVCLGRLKRSWWFGNVLEVTVGHSGNSFSSTCRHYTGETSARKGKEGGKRVVE